jgi:hypothetical protein
MKPKEYKVFENSVYELQENDLYTTYTKCKVPAVKNIDPVWKGALIPHAMWRDIIDWCVLSYEKFKSETLVFLYYDLNNKKNPWSFWIPPQITNGMTVKSNPDSKFFAEERKNFPDTMFGTVHHHCSSSAFQSGTDHSDELSREGLHFTIGNLDKPFDLDIHARITIGKTHGNAIASDLIEADPVLQKSFESLQATYQTKTIKKAFDTLHDSNLRSASKDYTKREKEFEKHYQKVEKPSYMFYGKHSQGFQTSLDDYWDEEEESKTSVKKKEEGATYDDIASDLIDNLVMTREVDDLRMEYKHSLESMYVLEDHVVINHVIEMIEDPIFENTSDGMAFHELLNDYLEQHWSGYVIDMVFLTNEMTTMSKELELETTSHI